MLLSVFSGCAAARCLSPARVGRNTVHALDKRRAARGNLGASSPSSARSALFFSPTLSRKRFLVAACVLAFLLSLSRSPNTQGGYDPDGMENQKRLWLFVSYLASFACIGGGIAALIVPGSITEARNHDNTWLGVALMLQTTLIIFSALLFWLTRATEMAF
jgi:hypothetical protein